MHLHRIRLLSPFAGTAFATVIWGLVAPVPAQVQNPQDAGARFSLEGCLGFAMEHNRELREAQLGRDVAGKQVREAWGAVFPSIDATVSYTRNLTDQVSLVPEIFFNPDADPNSLTEVRFAGENLWSSRVTLEQPLVQAEAFIGVGAASQFRALQDERVRGVAHAVATEVRNQYMAALLASAGETLTRASLDRVRRTLDGALELERAGLGSNYDVLRLQVEIARLEPNLRRAENDRLEAERQLKIAMGLDVNENISVAGSLASVDLDRPDRNDPEVAQLLDVMGVRVKDEADIPSIVQQALVHRSDLHQARLNSRLSQAQLSATRASVYPKLFGFTNFSIEAQDDGAPDFFGETSDQRTTNWQAGVRLEIPILEGGARYSRMAQRSLQVEQSLTREQFLEQQVAAEVGNLVRRLLEGRERVRSQAEAIRKAQRGFEIALAEFEQGLNTQFNALDAEVALRETEFNYAESIYEVFRTQAQLDAAVGIVPVVDALEEAQ